MTNPLTPYIKAEVRTAALGFTQKVAIIEYPEYILHYQGIDSVDEGCDTRLLTAIAPCLVPEYDYFIVVYSMAEMSKDMDVYNALILHELGHIHYPATGTVDVEIEAACDAHAVKYGYGQALKSVLSTATEIFFMGLTPEEVEEAKALPEIQLLTDCLNERIRRLSI